MSTEKLANDNAIEASIAELRERFPRTQDLYREVCILLFFRHGITPTANKLYHFVRKGSMSAPTEALSDFWNTLRERSRIRIEHADLPEDLKQAAGEMVGAIWKSAQIQSRNALASLQAESAVAVEAARAGEAHATGARAEAVEALERARAQIQASEEAVSQLRQELAAAAATRGGLESRLEDMRGQLANLQIHLDRLGEEHTGERKRLAERTQLAEERFAEMEKRVLLELDRERTASAKLQMVLESERSAHATARERLRADHNVAQTMVAQLREQVAALQSRASASSIERDELRAEVQGLRAQLETTVRQAAADNATTAHLREQLTQFTEARSRQERSVERTRATKGRTRPAKKPA